MTDACAACGLKEAPYYDSDGLCPLCSPDFDSGNLLDSTEPIRESAVNPPNGDDPDDSTLAIRQRAQALIAQHGGIRPAARARGREMGCKVNPGIIGLALKGEDFPKARQVLGLPPKTVPVEPCADCGQVHETKATCSHELQKARATKDYTVTFHLQDEELAIALRAVFDAHGRNRKEIAEKIVNGDLRIVEIER